MYRLYGMVAAFVFIIGAFAFTQMDKVANYRPAKGTISYIDRTCEFTETERSGQSKTTREVTDKCDSTGEWQKVRDEVRNRKGKKVMGDATMHVSYISPQDGVSREGELKFTGRDDEFYQLQAGDMIDILVSNSDPSKIRKG
jgi:hypothetical protein